MTMALIRKDQAEPCLRDLVPPAPFWRAWARLVLRPLAHTALIAAYLGACAAQHRAFHEAWAPPRDPDLYSFSILPLIATQLLLEGLRGALLAYGPARVTRNASGAWAWWPISKLSFQFWCMHAGLAMRSNQEVARCSYALVAWLHAAASAAFMLVALFGPELARIGNLSVALAPWAAVAGYLYTYHLAYLTRHKDPFFSQLLLQMRLMSVALVVAALIDPDMTRARAHVAATLRAAARRAPLAPLLDADERVVITAAVNKKWCLTENATKSRTLFSAAGRGTPAPAATRAGLTKRSKPAAARSDTP